MRCAYKGNIVAMLVVGIRLLGKKIANFIFLGNKAPSNWVLPGYAILV